MMTSTTNWWTRLVSAFLRPFQMYGESRLKLQHAMDMDRLAAEHRRFEEFTESQRTILEAVKDLQENNNAVIKEWLEGFHKLPATKSKALPVNNDERMWKLEMEELARQHGKQVAADMSPYELEALIRNGMNGL